MPGKRKRYADEQSIQITRDVESGKNIACVCWEYRLSEATVHRCRRKYWGMDQSERRGLKKQRAESQNMEALAGISTAINNIHYMDAPAEKGRPL